MKRTVYIPDALDKKIDEYLKEHPEESLSSIMQEAIYKKIAQKNVADFLALAGIIEDTSCNARDRAEDSVVTEEKT